MPALTIPTDEDVANRAIGDWPVLVPRAQKLAEASDGAFTNLDRWTLNSVSTNFATQSVAKGRLVIFAKDAYSDIVTDILAVESVAGTTALLRRPGMAVGVGLPPGPAAGATGLYFRILTATPQIERAHYEVRRRLNVDDADDLQDADDLRRAVVLMTLVNLYMVAARNLDDARDDYATKARAFKKELEFALVGLDSRYGTKMAGAGSASGAMTESVDASLFP